MLYLESYRRIEVAPLLPDVREVAIEKTLASLDLPLQTRATHDTLLHGGSIHTWGILRKSDLETANMLLNDGHARDAASQLCGLVEPTSDDDEALALYALCSIAAGDCQQALDAVDRAIKLNTDEPSLHVIRGEALLRLGEPAQALAAFDAALHLDFHDLDALVGRADASFAVAEFGAAGASYEEVLDTLPDSGRALSGLAKVLHWLGRTAEADAIKRRLQALEAVSAIQPASYVGDCDLEAEDRSDDFWADDSELWRDDDPSWTARAPQD